MNCVEAEAALNKMLNTLKPGETLLVIHGKGTGVLKNHVRKYLAGNRLIKKIIPGETGRLPGKEGVCLVILGQG